MDSKTSEALHPLIPPFVFACLILTGREGENAGDKTAAMDPQLGDTTHREPPMCIHPHNTHTQASSIVWENIHRQRNDIWGWDLWFIRLAEKMIL